MAGPAPVAGAWMPSHAWWPPAGDFAVRLFLTPYHAAVEPEARFAFTIRARTAGGGVAWEHDAGELAYGEQACLDLGALGLPPASEPHGGILDVATVRLDRLPKKGTGWIAMLLDATGPAGGYLIPTIPIRGAAKLMARDDLQVVPGVLASPTTDTELLVLNPIDMATTVSFTLASPDGLTSEAPAIELAPWGAWRGSLKRTVPRAAKLLEPSAGLGSLVVDSSHKTLPFFGLRRTGGFVVSMDHAAPIFGPVRVKRRVAP